MEIIENKNLEESWKDWEKTHKRGKVAGGLLLVAIGSLFMARELGVEIPAWIFTWKMLLIGFGLVGFIKHGFRQVFWVIPVLVGVAFLAAEVYPHLLIKSLIWPALAILVGLFIIFKPRHKHHRHWERWKKHRYYQEKYGQHENFHKHGWEHVQTEEIDDNYVHSVTVFGAIKKNVLSKDFKGGDVTVVFGGSEINLSQSEISDKAVLEITQVFGGTSLIVPSNWIIKSELVSVMGGIEDNRPTSSAKTGEKEQVLLLRGTIFCGGIEIKSYI